MNTIKLSEVKISELFLSCPPRQQKIDKVLKFISKYGKVDKPIILKDGVLVDGYTRYLAAQAVGLLEIPYVELNDMEYVVGRFSNRGKCYVWKNDKKLDVNIGNVVVVKTKYKKDDKVIKNGFIKIIHTFKSNDLELFKKHKSVVKKINK